VEHPTIHQSIALFSSQYSYICKQWEKYCRLPEQARAQQSWPPLMTYTDGQTNLVSYNTTHRNTVKKIQEVWCDMWSTHCRFNIETTVQVADSIQDEAFIVAQNNELFARVPLQGQLNEDTDAGKWWLFVSLSVSVSLYLSVSLSVSVDSSLMQWCSQLIMFLFSNQFRRHPWTLSTWRWRGSQNVGLYVVNVGQWRV